MKRSMKKKKNNTFFYKDNKERKFFTIISSTTGVILDMFRYHHSYENTYLCIIICRANGLPLYLPLYFIMYQHALGWGGIMFESNVSDILFKLLRVDDCTSERAHLQSKMVLFFRDVVSILDNDSYLGDAMPDTPLEVVSSALAYKNSDDVGNDGGGKGLNTYQGRECLSMLPDMIDMANGSYDRKKKERYEERRRVLRGPACEADLVLWEKLMYKADRGHRDDEFTKLWDQMKDHPHIIHFVNNVFSDLGRSFLWCCASRKWNDFAFWAIQIAHADPHKEAGKGSALDIAKRYNNFEFISFVTNSTQQ
eukprot:TRINITY_DN23957_c0_g1_i1.p1 TRINITY_DN23957_c0_g1~~TRINITY_DN23957_c0_g1_i1.p1  ORF type:complete len:309 (+),score=56.65 TRINITY_DN23957_c0_g1_i1:435-1361(+)